MYKTLDCPAKLTNDRTFVPIRAFAEAIGADVSYDTNSKTAYVNYFTYMTGDLKLSGSTTVQPIAEAAGAKLAEKNPVSSPIPLSAAAPRRHQRRCRRHC